MKRLFKAAIVIVSMSVLSMPAVQSVERSASHSSLRKTARSHSSSARASKKQNASHESKSRSQIAKHRAAAAERERDRAREEAQVVHEENAMPTPPVELPRHDDGRENDIESNENGTANLMGLPNESQDNGSGP